jgi:hypothetical protein
MCDTPCRVFAEMIFPVKVKLVPVVASAPGFNCPKAAGSLYNGGHKLC